MTTSIEMNTFKGLRWSTLLRLSLFQACLGTLAVLFTGTFNRILITELSFPALLAGGGLAFEQLVSPARVLFGHLSDSNPLFGRYRTPYVLLGTIAICLLAILSVPVSFRVKEALDSGSPLLASAGIAAFCGLFALYGLGTSMASTCYLALVIDRTTEEQRSRCIAVIWSMLTVGIIVGAIAISLAVRRIDGISDPIILQSWLQKFMIVITAIVMSLAIISTWGVEQPTGTGNTSAIQDLITIRDAWGVISTSRQIMVFFGFLVLFTLGLFLQDPILESFGAEVFAMPVSKTTLLNAWWGSGTLVGLMTAGWFITPKIGKLSTARLGCWLVMGSLLLLLISGWRQVSGFLPVVMLIFGLAAGISSNSALTLMLDLTLPEMAGTFVGIWGLAQALSRGFGKVIGGGLLDLGRHVLPNAGPMAGYALVFSIEIIVMACALIVLNQLSINKFKETTTQRLEMVLMAEIDG